MEGPPKTVQDAAAWLRGLTSSGRFSAAELARRAQGVASEQGDTRKISQQQVSLLENGKPQKLPDWFRYVWRAVEIADEETAEDPYLSTGKTDATVQIRHLPTFVGLGGGGTGEGDSGHISFSRSLIEDELRAPADSLLAMVAEGNSMEPDFRGGDQILVDTRRTSLAQPGAFCLWDGDGHVIKYLEKVHGSDPPRVRVISRNDTYTPHERLVEELNLIGRVVWFGRRVQ